MSEILPALIMMCFFFIGHGLLGLFARDILWDFAQFGNAISGRTSERTPLWDMWQRVMGVISILLGLGVGVMGWKGVEVERARDEQTAHQETVALLDRAFAPHLATLQASATTTPQQSSISDAQQGMIELEYGLCEDGSFYMIVLDFGGETGDYVYTTRYRPCALDHVYMLITDDSLLGSVTGGHWFQPVALMRQPEAQKSPSM